MTSNGSVNYSFARRAVREYGTTKAWVALDPAHRRVTDGMLKEIHARVLFGEPRSVERWQHQIRRGSVVVERWIWEADSSSSSEPWTPLPAELRNDGLPLATYRGGLRPLDRRFVPRPGDELVMAVVTGRAAGVAEWLENLGWQRKSEEA